MEKLKELVISAQRLGCHIIPDSYAEAPAMQLAHSSMVFNMLDGEKLRML